MARQPYFVNSNQKTMEIFDNFGGGMVTEPHQEKLRNNESVLLENVNIMDGGAIEARGAYAQTNTCEIIYYNNMSDFEDEMITFNDLEQYTFDYLKNTGLSKPNRDPSKYFTLIGDWEIEGITFDTLENYTFDQLEKEGVIKPNTGDTQGFFRYNKDDGTYMDIIALNGKLYYIENTNTYKKLSISGLRNFQSKRPIEAVQHRDKMYIATGSGVVVFDGESAYLLEAYKPNGLEALYIGTNGYAVDPSSFLSDGVGAGVSVMGLTVSDRYGVVNESLDFTAYIQKPEASVLEFKFETKKTSDIDYTIAKDWSTSKVFTTSFKEAGDYMVRVSVRNQGETTVLTQYILPKYTVNTIRGKAEEEVNFEDLSSCNRIFVHYDRLYLYGDAKNKDHLYGSHLDNFAYFPRTNVIKVTDPLRGSLQKVEKYKSFLVAWTNGSVQTITGTAPAEFEIQAVHTTIGTLFPESVQIMKNYIAFVGNDYGIYILKSFNYASDDKLNVDRIDGDIHDSISKLLSTSTKILSTIYNNQYYLYVENDTQNYIYRFYYEKSAWVRDKIKLSLKAMNTFYNTLVLCDTNHGTIYQLNEDKFLDGVNQNYVMRVLSKDFNFDIPHHRKKLKQYQLITNLSPVTTLNVEVYADDNLLSRKPLGYDPNQRADAQKLMMMASGRFRTVKVEINTIVKEKVQLLGFGFVFKPNTPK